MRDPWSELGPVAAIIEAALAEDLASGDVTGRATVGPEVRARAHMVAKANLVVAGLQVTEAVFRRVEPGVGFAAYVRDGARVAVGTEIACIEGPAQALLAAERTALNLLQRMSGVATLTRAYVDAAGGRCRITDTRKTMPGLRALDRYAVRCGGGHNHRNDLGAAVLIKENHVRAAGGITAAIERARQVAPHTMKIECEVTSHDELREALAAGADIIMLDNMDDAAVREAVAITAGKAILEVSGGVGLERIAAAAQLGIDVISVGRLTHSVPAADISLLFERADGTWA
ncbi:carboxylating nicotinate-nucleotide diphosphorylase [Nannocystis sp. ILAH1]|uniref:carboxylating nicotinate-nucleotide diphosphorylase n=1 Tax=unclassified Nannocystis TaxID=2627009 RepID=UPI00226EF62D|nr:MULTISPECIES: carboxylating nicotinate-nucleotide diphosphorylase [unclassified Nannocystis]MCY0991829.1 carboxylating nicotinate-nucleotide diphosphorylase [Nannocystis sp. ILAH1]MCY1067372.1 carboxylating nicotinate-nucleotide diphosphorylase [Nannocystis sp. RBIL2]